MSDVDVVVDCSDNFTTRFALNAACVHSGVALVSGAALRWEGQVAVFFPAEKIALVIVVYMMTMMNKLKLVVKRVYWLR